ncbi:MAG: hypothetical protein HKO53_02900 [Gemmatimonadetes bacterium]|nr:hypothetical protein [Gemmatimonadota bacterium]
MIESIKRTFVRVGLVISAILIAYGGWRWGSAVFPRAEAMLGIDRPEETAPEATPEIAARTQERVEAFLQGAESELRLEGVEVSSVLNHTIPGMIPTGVHRPLVLFRDDLVEFHAAVVRDRLPDGGLDQGFGGILPDTFTVEVRGTLMPFGDAGAVFMVSRVQAEGLPLPRKVYREVLQRMMPGERPGLPVEAIPVPMPDGFEGAYVQDGALVLIRQ